MGRKVGPSVDPNFRWVTPRLSPDESKAEQRKNEASLKRKITYCVNRSSEPLQWQWVEGWTTGQVLDQMRRAGISEARIQRDLYGRR